MLTETIQNKQKIIVNVDMLTENDQNTKTRPGPAGPTSWFRGCRTSPGAVPITAAPPLTHVLPDPAQRGPGRRPRAACSIPRALFNTKNKITVKVCVGCRRGGMAPGRNRGRAPLEKPPGRLWRTSWTSGSVGWCNESLNI